MRTTLAIDDDVLEAAKGLAERDHKTVGEVVSELARRGLKPAPSVAPARTRNGVPLLEGRSGARPVTPEMVNRLRDEIS
jgi:hypothetical protein